MLIKLYHLIIKNREIMLNPSHMEIEDLQKIITLKNINTIFSDDLPAVLKNAYRIKAKYSNKDVIFLF